MSEVVEYLVVAPDGLEVMPRIAELLTDSLSDIIPDEVPDATEALNFIGIRYDRNRQDGTRLVGVSVTFDLPAEDERLDTAVATFSKALTQHAEETGLLHAVKMFDPVLLARNIAIASELFELEMRLREALSIAFIDSLDTDFYEILSDSDVTLGSTAPTEEQMRADAQNQLFFMLFDQYPKVADRKRNKDVSRLLDNIAEATSFEDLQARLSPKLPLKDRYADFIASLGVLMPPVHNVRHAVAHNRAVSARSMGNYAMAREPVMKAIRDFLAHFAAEHDDEASAILDGEQEVGIEEPES